MITRGNGTRTAVDRPRTPSAVAVAVTSYGLLHAPAPSEVDIMLDLRRVLRDPHVDPELRALTGLHPRVRQKVISTPGAAGLVERITAAAAELVVDTGRPVTVGVACAGGRHRSVVVAELVAAKLRHAGLRVLLTHRDVARPVVDRRPDAS